MLELEHIQKAFDGVPVLKDLSLQVEDGEIVSILGPSGCGKTTLLNIILGIVDADQGEIRYSGEDLTRTPMEKRGFNIVFQDYALFPNLNVQQNITYGLRNKPGISSREEVDELIDLLGLREHLDKRIDQLSGGQKQRVALARTLVMKPRILLLDEPLSALDGVIKESIKDRIKTIAREYHLTTIIVTHDPEEALTLSDRVLIIDQGSISQYARPDEIVHQPRNDFVRKFILRQLATARSWPARLFEERRHETEKLGAEGDFLDHHPSVRGLPGRPHPPAAGQVPGGGGRIYLGVLCLGGDPGGISHGPWQQLCGGGRGGHGHRLPDGLCGPLHRIAQVGQAVHHRHRDPAHVPAHHHLWLCHHLLLRQTGAAHPPAGTAVL